MLFVFPTTVFSESTLEVIQVLPHSGYSEGLDYHQGALWHATPTHILKISATDGSVLEKFTPATSYSESIVWWGNTLLNLSYEDGPRGNGIYSGSLKNGKLEFTRVGTVPEEKAWGITHDGKHLIVTGTHDSRTLYFLSPKNFELVKKIETSIADLEDLAWDGEGIWSSSFTQHRAHIFRINPQTGKVEGLFKLPEEGRCPVIDGIAHQDGKLWITGKHCPSIYVVKKPSIRILSSDRK